MNLDAGEKELLESVERGEWKSATGGQRERTRYVGYAKATFRWTPFRHAREVGEERDQPLAPPRRLCGLARRPVPECRHLGVDPCIPVPLGQLRFGRFELGSPLGRGRR